MCVFLLGSDIMSTSLKDKSTETTQSDVDFSFNKLFSESHSEFKKSVFVFMFLSILCVITTLSAFLTLYYEKRCPKIFNFFINNDTFISDVYGIYITNFDFQKHFAFILSALSIASSFIGLFKSINIIKVLKRIFNSRKTVLVLNLFLLSIYSVNAIIFVFGLLLRIYLPVTITITTYIFLCFFKAYIYIIFEHSDNKGNHNNE